MPIEGTIDFKTNIPGSRFVAKATRTPEFDVRTTRALRKNTRSVLSRYVELEKTLTKYMSSLYFGGATHILKGGPALEAILCDGPTYMT
ncbi:hypothetical protein EGYY_04600 [Eggerthella sp. YY7918]|nr:hypothetical protein EGYY_04600 [Eggerthella sp. YY7918]